ncbi:MAG: hypothetical protein HP008_03970 [Clostridia bacterium]|nr:hypothetical protein [Clostridia bacterium]
MKEKLRLLKYFNWGLFVSLCALALVPAIYQTIKTFIISSNAQNTAFDIIGQMEWFDLINETLVAFLIVPLYSVLNKILKENESDFAGYTFKIGLIAFLVYAVFSVGVLVYGSGLIKAMNPEETDLTAVRTYLRLETVAFMIGVILEFINVVFIVVGKAKNVYIFLAVRTVFSVTADFILIPAFGVYGVAASNIIVNAILSFICFLLLYFQKYIKFSLFNKKDLPVLKRWLQIGVFSGVQQFLDNFIYAVMVCKMVNAVARQGDYWIANNFIWGWLLIPVTALGEVIKRDCKDGYNKLIKTNYFFIVLFSVAAWILTVPLWTPFFEYAENLPNAGEIFSIVIKLAPFYISYAGCVVIDGIFTGLGKTYYNMINSLIINLVYYGIFYLLYVTNAITFSLGTIIFMFGFGMVLHFIISIIEEKAFLVKSEQKNGERLLSPISDQKTDSV